MNYSAEQKAKDQNLVSQTRELALQLVRLTNDPHPGIATWTVAVVDTITALAGLLDSMPGTITENVMDEAEVLEKLAYRLNEDANLLFLKVGRMHRRLGGLYHTARKETPTSIDALVHPATDYQGPKTCPIHGYGGQEAATVERERREKMVQRCRPLLRLLTVRQVIEAGDDAILAAGLNPWAMNEGLATGDEKLNLWWLE